MKKQKYITYPEATANRTIVEAMTKHLIAAFEDFLTKYPDDTVTFRDTLMGTHNFHAHMILDLVERSDGQTLWLDAAESTFRERMERERQRRRMELPKGKGAVQ